MTERNIQSNRMRESSTSSPKSIILNTKQSKLYVTARKPSIQQLQAAEMATQLGSVSIQSKDRIEQSMEVSEGFLFKFELL